MDGHNEQLELPLEDAQTTPVDGQSMLGSAADIASAFFMKEKARLKMLLGRMSSKQLRRTFMNAVSYPLVDKGDTPKTVDEKDAAHLASDMLLNKAMIVMATEMQKVEAAMNKQRQEAVNTIEEGKTDGET